MRRGNYFRNLAARFKHGSVATLFITTQFIFLLSASGVVSAAPPTGNPAANDSQCYNGSLTSPADCTAASDWGNGNSNSNKSHYREGDSIPYRVVFSNLSTGPHTFTFSYRTTKVNNNNIGSGHAIDYLTSYDATVKNADPCVGVSTCTTPNLFPIPTDPNVLAAGVKQISGSFAMFNGTITNVSPYSLSGPYTGTSTTTLTISFNYDDTQPNPVLAWGGHIASEIDWGLGNGAAGISGSPYHTWQVDLDGLPIGAQDMQLMASSILPVPSIFTTVSSANINVGDFVTDTANLSGPASPLSGTVSFYVCSEGATPCLAGNGTADGAPVAISPGTGTAGTAISPQYQVTEAGKYCFGALYTPDATADYSPIDETDFSQECFTATIPNSTIEIIKDANPNSSQAFTFDTSSNLVATGSFSLADNGTPNTNSKTFTTVAPGTYTVTEQPTSNWDFKSLDCGNNSNVLISGTTATITITGGQSVVCTYTNTERGTINVIKTVDDGGNTTQDASGWNWNLNGTGNYTDGATTPVDVSAGSYTVSEAQQAQSTDYHVTSSSCSDGTTTTYTTPASTTQNVTLAPGENIVCYFTNTRNTGTVTVNKTLVPSNDFGRFDLHINGPTSSTKTDQGNNGSTGAQTVITGSYNVSETAYAGTNMNDYSSTYECTSGNNVIETGSGQTTPNFTVNSNDNIVCTFTNTRLATLTIIKIASPFSSTPFSFTTTGTGLSNFSLTDDSQTTTSNQKPFTDIAPGSYSVTEGTTTGWSLTDLHCNQSSYSANISTGELNVTLSPGENLTCTFTNTELGSISGYKFEVNADSTIVNPLAGITIELLVNGSVKQSTTTGGDGSYSFTGLLPGTFTLEEIMPSSGWTQIYSPGSVNLGAGQVSVNNNFGNFKDVSINGYKFNDLNANGVWNSGEPALSGWTIRLYDSSGKFKGQSVTDSNGEYSITNIGPGNYKLCEVMQAGWVQTFPGNPASPSCQNVSVTESGHSLYGYNFGNVVEDSITISKTNNRPNPTTVGDTVTYTLIVTVPKYSHIVYNAIVIDTPPDNFKVDNSTATAQLTRNGLTTFLNVPDPNYGSPGTWRLGTLMPGDVVVLTYQATIQSNVSDGIYPDLAYVTGFSQPDNGGYQVIGNITNLSSPSTTPFVGTLVSVISPLPIGTYTAPRIVGPPELVNTGTNLLAAQYILPVVLAGGVIIVSRRNAKTGRGDK